MSYNHSKDNLENRVINTINDLKEQSKALRTGQLTPENWHTVTYNSGWVDWGGGFGGATYYKDGLGVVYLQGLVKNTVTTATGSAIFQLPVGYRPSISLVFGTVSNDAFAELRIDTSGNVMFWVGSTTSNSYMSLNGISFRSA